MAHFLDSPLESGMSLLTVTNKITKPQDGFLFRPMTGVDKDGETVRVVDMEAEFMDKYFVLFFFPMDFKVDSSEVLSFKQYLEEFSKNNCEIVGVTSDNPLAVKRWISKDVSSGGFGGPLGFPILIDKDLSLSMLLGVARDCGLPARATFIIDWTGKVRYMMVHRSDIGRSVKEILRLVQAFRHSDLTGEALASGWTPGGEVIPTDFTEKVKYFINKFGHGKETTPKVEEEEDVDEASVTAAEGEAPKENPSHAATTDNIHAAELEGIFAKQGASEAIPATEVSVTSLKSVAFAEKKGTMPGTEKSSIKAVYKTANPASEEAAGATTATVDEKKVKELDDTPDEVSVKSLKSASLAEKTSIKTLGTISGTQKSPTKAVSKTSGLMV